MNAGLSGVQALGLVFVGLMLRAVGAVDVTDPYEYYPDNKGGLTVSSNAGTFTCPMTCQSFFTATGCHLDPYSASNPPGPTSQTCNNTYGRSSATALVCTSTANGKNTRYSCTQRDVSSKFFCSNCRKAS